MLRSSGFAELLDGVVSVRAFSVEKRFMTLLCEQVDKTHSAYYYYWVCLLPQSINLSLTGRR